MMYKDQPIPYVVNFVEEDITNLLVSVDISDINEEYMKRVTLVGESAQEVSLKLYETSEYYWVIYLINDIVNPFEDWHMSPTQLRNYVNYKYDDPDKPYEFYYISSGEPLNNKLSNDMFYLFNNKLKLPHDISFYSNFDYEARINDSKKTIKVIKPEMILEFINIYQERLYNL